MRQAHGGWDRERGRRCREGCCTGGELVGTLNQEDSAADGGERGFKRCGEREDSIGPDVDECKQCRSWGPACAEAGLCCHQCSYHLVHENGFPGDGQCSCRTAWILSIKHACKVL